MKRIMSPEGEEIDLLLIDYLREALDLTGTKTGMRYRRLRQLHRHSRRRSKASVYDQASYRPWKKQ